MSDELILNFFWRVLKKSLIRVQWTLTFFASLLVKHKKVMRRFASHLIESHLELNITEEFRQNKAD